MTTNKFIDIDNYIRKCNMELSVSKYLNTGILDKTYFKYNNNSQFTNHRHYPVFTPENIESDIIINRDISFNEQTINLLTDSIQVCNQLYTIIDREIKNQKYIGDTYDDCPICLCKLANTNIVIPKCNHKICIRCFTNNLRSNSYTGNLCSICRETIVI